MGTGSGNMCTLFPRSLRSICRRKRDKRAILSWVRKGAQWICLLETHLLLLSIVQSHAIFGIGHNGLFLEAVRQQRNRCWTRYCSRKVYLRDQGVSVFPYSKMSIRVGSEAWRTMSIYNGFDGAELLHACRCASEAA